jgi:hypothetical protein
VPQLSRDQGRNASDAGARQLAAAGAVGAAGPGCLHLGCDEGHDGAVRGLQGLPPRMPDGRRHGADEDRIPAPLPRAPRPAAARTAGGLPAALCAGGRAAARDAEPARPGAGAGVAVGTAGRAGGRAQAAGMAQALGRKRAGGGAGRHGGRRAGPDPVRRHLQPVFRTREPDRRRNRAGRGAGYRLHRAPAPDRPLVLRPHLPCGRAGRRGAGRGAARAGGAATAGRQGRAWWGWSRRAF